MRIAVVSDIHGNLAAFEAVLADLRLTSPDVIFHGGDLAAGGSSPAKIVDRIREFGWQGVLGNTDELLFSPEALTKFAGQSPVQYQPLFTAIGEMAEVTRKELGEERLEWLSRLPPTQTFEAMALVHARPGDLWRAPTPEAADDELESAYEPLGRNLAIYAHIHRSYVRRTSRMAIANTGSVSLPYDGDTRASYLLLDGSEPMIRRVEYDIAREIESLRRLGMPHVDWIAKTLTTGTFQMP
jgi:predicted phosphodiesterase